MYALLLPDSKGLWAFISLYCQQNMSETTDYTSTAVDDVEPIHSKDTLRKT